MGFWERLTRGGVDGLGGGHHGGSRSHGHGGRGDGCYQPDPPMHQQRGPTSAQAGLKCRQCNAQNATGARFCGTCGRHSWPPRARAAGRCWRLVPAFATNAASRVLDGHGQA